MIAQHEFTFGVTPCVITTDGIPSVARLYVIKDDGLALRVIGDRAGHLVVIRSAEDFDALGRAVRYLADRFGATGPPRRWPSGTERGVAPAAVEIQRRLGDILRDVLH